MLRVCRGRLAGIALGAVALLVCAGEGTAMGNAVTGTGIALACRAGDPKVALTEAICTLMVDRLALAYPQSAVWTVADPAVADAVLEVLRADGQRFEARLNWAGAQPGRRLAAARMDAALDSAAIAALMDGIIKETPRP